MATHLPIDERLETAGNLVVRSRIFYDIWTFYEGHETRLKIIDSMNKYPEFFRYDIHAHFVAFVISIAGLFDGRSDTVNSLALVSELGALNLVPAATIAEAKSLLDGIHSIIPKVKILRSTMFAHRSASITYEEAFTKADIKQNQLDHLCKTALRIVNRLLLARGLDEKIIHTLSRSHLEAMLNVLAKSSSI